MVKKIIGFFLKIILLVVSFIIKVVIKLECIAAFILGLCALLCIGVALGNHLWMVVVIYGGLILIGVLCIYATAWMKIGVDLLIEQL